MATTKKISFISIPLIAILAYVIYKNTYTEFEPTRLEGNSYKTVTVDSVFYKNLEYVLEYNNVTYKIGDHGKILIKRKLIANKELLLNYTKKALDTGWLHSHRGVE